MSKERTPLDFLNTVTEGRIEDTKKFNFVQVPVSYLKRDIGTPGKDNSKLRKLIESYDARTLLLETSHNGYILGEIKVDKKDTDCFYIYPVHQALMNEGNSDARRVHYNNVNAVLSSGRRVNLQPGKQRVI